MNKPTVAVLLLTIMASATKVMAIDLDVDNDTRVCNDQAGAPFCTIQGALDVSSPGDVIAVQGGTDYPVHLDINTENLSIVGVGRPNLTFAISTLKPIVTINAPGVRLEGFDIVALTTGIVMLSSNNTITHNVVVGAHGLGIGVGHSSTPVPVFGNVITDNHVRAGSVGGIVVNGGHNTVARNQIVGETQGLDRCVFISGNSNTLRQNHSSNCLDGFAIFGKRNRVLKNRAVGNLVGFNLSQGFGFNTGSSRKNRLIRNVATGNTTVGFNDALDGKKRNIYRNNKCRDNGLHGSLPFGLCKPQQ